MRSVAYSIVAAIMLIPAYQGFSRGDAWFGWSYVACSFLLFMAPSLLPAAVEVEREPEPSPFDPWRQSPPFAPTANAPADTAQPAGAIGAAPATLER